MAMSFIRKVFHCSENKFFAVLFASLALLITVGWMIYSIVVLGAGFFSFLNIWNYFVLFLVFGTLLIYNIHNDNRAYTAISLLLFVSIVGSVIDVVYALLPLGRMDAASWAMTTLPIMGLDVLTIVIASLAFVNLNRYRTLRMDDHKKVRLWLVLFAISALLPSLVNYFIYLGLGTAVEAWLVLVTALASDFATLCAAVSAVFTFNRLIR